jgi:hypothetical protein
MLEIRLRKETQGKLTQLLLKTIVTKEAPRELTSRPLTDLKN